MYDQAKLDAIVKECTDHNADICDDVREPDRVLQDAKFIYMVRHKDVTVETLAMMFTDTEFALRAARAKPSTPAAEEGGPDDGE